MTRVGVAFSGGLTPPDIVECVQLAETLGYESLPGYVNFVKRLHARALR